MSLMGFWTLNVCLFMCPKCGNTTRLIWQHCYLALLLSKICAMTAWKRSNFI